MGKIGIRNKDIGNSGLRNPLVMKGNILPISWKAFGNNQERYSLLRAEKTSKHPIPRYLEIQNSSPAAGGGLPVPQK